MLGISGGKAKRKMADRSIKKMFYAKQKAIKLSQLKREKSILYFNSLNSAIAFLPEGLKGTDKGWKQIWKWQPRFIEKYYQWAIENMPMDKLTLAEKDQIETEKVEDARRVEEINAQLEAASQKDPIDIGLEET